MTVTNRSLLWFLLPMALAAYLLWLAPERLAGVDTGLVGSALAVLAVWAAASVMSRLPRNPGSRLSPVEQQAWIGLVFVALIYAYLLSKTGALAAADTLVHDHGARRIGSHIALMAIAWAWVMNWLKQRREGEVLEDERDRLLAARAGVVGNSALPVGVVGLIIALAFTPATLLKWATPNGIAIVLLHMLILRSLVEYGATVILYGWDRR